MRSSPDHLALSGWNGCHKPALGDTSVTSLIEQFGPVARHAAAGTWNRLVLGTAHRWREFGAVVVVVGLVIPKPSLPRLERSDDRVPRLSPVRRRVPGRRVVAATDVAAARTPP